MKFTTKAIQRKLVLFILFSFTILPAFSQIINVTGTVTDESGEPITGVNVVQQGTTNGTITDLNGNYTLPNVTIGSTTLTFRFIGFHTETVEITANKRYDVMLREDSEILDEVVVVAYGVQKKANLTGAVSAVKVNDIKDIPVSNTSSLLQGRMSGVTVSSFSAQPGKDDDVEIRIRGIGTFGNNNPMVLIDGVEGRLADVEPTSIENISVLKDAASAAIYGVRAANGVILVTTKRGSSEKRTLSYSGSYGIQQATVLPEYVSSWDWATLHNEQNQALGETIFYTPDMIQKMRDSSAPELFANTNWNKEVFRSAPIQTHNISMSGGGGTSKYMATVGFMDQQGIMEGTGTSRFNVRLNADTKYFDKLVVGMNLSGNYQKTDEPYSGSQDITEKVRWFSRPTVPVKYNNGDWGFTDGSTMAEIKNPVYDAQKGFNYSKTYRFNGKIFADLELIKNLHIRSSFAYSYNSAQGKKFKPTDQPKRADGTPVGQGTLINEAQQSSWSSTQWINENIITYDLNVKNHAFNFLVGNAIQLNTEEGFWGSVFGFPNNNIHQLDAGTENPQVGGNAYEAALVSWFGRINYSYKDRYLLEANLRIDQSSRISPHHRTGYFPSFSAGWNMKNENFLKDVNGISMLKLRGSWGQLGNQEIGNYAFRQHISPGSNYIWGDTKVSGTSVQNLANPSIKWETTTITDIGIDGGFLNNRLTFTTDYYIKNTKDILLQIPIPGAMGFVNPPYTNAATVRNRGWELEVGYKDSFNAFNFEARFNVSKVKNEITHVNDMEWISGSTINKSGYAIGTYYGYVADGLYRTQEQIDAVTNNVGQAKIGDIKLRDISGPDGVPDGVIDAMYDRVALGNPFPSWTYGLNINMEYKGIDFAAFFQGVDDMKRIVRDYPTLAGNAPQIMMDRYHETNNPTGNYPRLGNADYNSVISSYWLKDVSYLRFKNMELGYSFPRKWTSKAGLERLRIYVSAQNILTLTNLENYDPEKVTGDDRNYAYPNAKTFSIGLNINL